MGCDIHWYIEVRHDDQKWRVGKFNGVPFNWLIPRNYELCGRLAGVRAYNTVPIDKPRGMPQDADHNLVAVWEKYKDTMYSVSWYTLDELIPHKDVVKMLGGRFVNMMKLHQDPTHIRAVFWFGG